MGREVLTVASESWEAYWRDADNLEWWRKPAPEVVELIASLDPHTYSRVLDLGCGPGRHAIAFAQAGFDVTATDASSEAVRQLQDWAKLLGLSVASAVCDAGEQPFPWASFDVVISYNVIYHGHRSDFVKAIRHIHDLLRPGGLFFFTCPSRRDGKDGHGKCVAPHTYAASKSVLPGDVHYFTSRRELDEMLDGFLVHSIHLDEGYWSNKGEEQLFSNWQVLAERTRGLPN